MTHSGLTCESCGLHGIVTNLTVSFFKGEFLSVRIVEVRRCLDCRAWLSVGASNDTPDALLELRAIELAAGIHEGPGWWTEWPKGMNVDEIQGWFEWHPLGMPGWLVGRFARHIALHDEEQLEVAQP